MTITAMVTRITDVGKAAAIDADNAGLSIKLTHIAAGDGIVEPDATTTALSSERERVEILSAAKIDPATLEVGGVLQSSDSYTIREIGFFTDDGTLFAIAWRAAGIVEKAADIPYPIQFNLDLRDVPESSVTVDVTLTLDLAYLGNIAVLTTAVAGLTRRQMDQELRLRVLEGSPTGGMEGVD